MQYTQPRPGDKISYRFGITARHYGIYVGNGRVIDNSAKRGRVGYSRLNDFTSRDSFRIDQRAPPGESPRVVARARGLLGRKYNLVRFNCEHVANKAHSGAATSQQVANAAAVGGAIALVGIAGAVLYSTSGWDSRSGVFRRRNGRFRNGPRWLG